MSSTGHFSVQQGKRVMVHLKNGEKLIKKFKERKGNTVEFYDGTEIRTRDARTIQILTGRQLKRYLEGRDES